MAKENEIPPKEATSLSSALFRAQRDLTQSLLELQGELAGRFKELNDQYADAYTSSMSRPDGAAKLSEAHDNYVRSWNRIAPDVQQEYVKRVRDVYRDYVRAAQEAMARADLDDCTPMELAMASQLLYAAANQALGVGIPWSQTA